MVAKAIDQVLRVGVRSFAPGPRVLVRRGSGEYHEA
jgi:hypothetical protein